MQFYKFAAWIALLFFVLAASAAQESRTVQGIVRNQAGNPIAGAAVKLKDVKTLVVRSYISKSDGAYSFSGLNRDFDYEVQATFQGRNSSVHRLSRFDSKPVTVIDLVIEGGSN